MMYKKIVINVYNSFHKCKKEQRVAKRKWHNDLIKFLSPKKDL